MKGKFLIPFAASFLILTPLFYFVDYNYSTLQGSSLDNNVSAVINSVADETEVIKEIKPDTTSQTILLAGDSMADGIKIFLSRYAGYNGHKLVGGGWTSSTTGSWSEKKKLKALIEKFNPTYIIMVLGSNELFSLDLEKREKYVRDIIEQAGDVNTVWVGPPNWQEDKGFNDMLRNVLGDKKFYASKEIFLKEPLKYKRGPDKRHPNMEGYSVWTDNVADWIMHKSDYPIKLEKPAQ